MGEKNRKRAAHQKRLREARQASTHQSALIDMDADEPPAHVLAEAAQFGMELRASAITAEISCLGKPGQTRCSRRLVKTFACALTVADTRRGAIGRRSADGPCR
jgi:hypothetical protein